MFKNHAAHQPDVHGVSGCWPWPVLDLAVKVIWGVKRSFSFMLYFQVYENKFFKQICTNASTNNKNISKIVLYLVFAIPEVEYCVY